MGDNKIIKLKNGFVFNKDTASELNLYYKIIEDKFYIVYLDSENPRMEYIGEVLSDEN